MNFLPKLLMSKEDLKRQVNTLLNEDDAMPKPRILPGPPTNKILFEGPLPPKEALEAEKQPLPATPKKNNEDAKAPVAAAAGASSQQKPVASPLKSEGKFEDTSVKQSQQSKADPKATASPNVKPGSVAYKSGSTS